MSMNTLPGTPSKAKDTATSQRRGTLLVAGVTLAVFLACAMVISTQHETSFPKDHALSSLNAGSEHFLDFDVPENEEQDHPTALTEDTIDPELHDHFVAFLSIEPAETCTVTFYSKRNGKGKATSKVFTSKSSEVWHLSKQQQKNIGSVKLEGAGCTKAELWDEDKCTTHYKDNIWVKTGLTKKLPHDLDDDVCAIRVDLPGSAVQAGKLTGSTSEKFDAQTEEDKKKQEQEEKHTTHKVWVRFKRDFHNNKKKAEMRRALLARDPQIGSCLPNTIFDHDDCEDQKTDKAACNNQKNWAGVYQCKWGHYTQDKAAMNKKFVSMNNQLWNVELNNLNVQFAEARKKAAEKRAKEKKTIKKTIEAAMATVLTQGPRKAEEATTEVMVQGKIWDKIKAFFKRVWEAIKKFFSKIFGMAVEELKTLSTKVVPMITSGELFTKEGLKKAGDLAKESGKKIADAAVEGAKDLANETIKDATKTAGEVASDLKDMAAKKVDEVANKVSNTTSVHTELTDAEFMEKMNLD